MTTRTPHILYVATADARGHLMRAQLLVHAMRDAGAQVQLITTSDAGQQFLAKFGLDAPVLSRHYAVQFDAHQNMLRRETNRNVARYVLDPTHMLRDIMRLRAMFRHADLVINDSFHPALLFMGAIPAWRRKIVYVYGGSLKRALTENFEDRLPGVLARAFSRIVNWRLDAARGCIEHDFACDAMDDPDGRHFHLPTPVPVAALPIHAGHKECVKPVQHAAAIYLNPHFRDIALADALCAGIHAARLDTHQVGEGYAGHNEWIGVDCDWVTRAAHAPLIVSAPGMAALSIARIYQRPILLVLTDQPEQMTNARRAAQLGLRHRVVVWHGDAADFRQQVTQAANELMVSPGIEAQAAEGRATAQARISAWTTRILGFLSHAPAQALTGIPALPSLYETPLQHLYADD